jgi:hypothetical protein
MSRLIVLSNRVKTSDNQPMAGGACGSIARYFTRKLSYLDGLEW